MLGGIGVTHVVDVRELPLSRRPGLSKTALARALGEVGIGYTHVRGLGNPKENRERYRSGDVAAGRQTYRRRLLQAAMGELEALAALAEREAVCLLCFERDPAQCHRQVIVEELQRLRGDLRVRHL